MVEAAIGLGLVISLAFTEFFGLAAGGMVVPGYLALEIQYPGRVALTFLCALLTYWIVKGISRFALVYGRRRTAAMIIVGFVLRYSLEGTVVTYFPVYSEAIAIIGYIVPGLIAVWIARQGILETLSTTVMAAVFVRLSLILLTGWGVLS